MILFTIFNVTNVDLSNLPYPLSPSLSLSPDIIDSYRKSSDTVLATVTAKRLQKTYTYEQLINYYSN